MIILALRLELMIYSAQSLKEKRSVVKSVIQKLKNKFNVSVAEVEYNDQWQRCALGCAFVSNEKKHCDAMADSITGYFDKEFRVEIIRIEKAYY